MNVLAGVIGLLFLILGILAIAYRDKADDLNMRLSPRWIKPRDGGGVFAPSQKRPRVRNQTVGAIILVGVGLFLIGAALLKH